MVVVTGSTANIGRAIALAFAAEGARVALVGRDRAKGEEIAGFTLAAQGPSTDDTSCEDLEEPFHLVPAESLVPG